MKTARLGFISLLVVIFGLSSLAYAESTYTVYVRNNTNLDMKVNYSEDKSDCINAYPDMPIVLKAQQETSFTFADKNTAFTHCYFGEKYLTIYADAVSGDQSVTVKWDHDYNMINGRQIWQSEITQTSTSDSNDYILNAATCGGDNCFNKWVDIDDDSTIRLTINYNAGSISTTNIKTLGLGVATVTNGYGKSVGSDGSLDLSEGPFVIHFSKTEAECRFNGGLLSCDKGIDYTYINDDDSGSDKLVFACSQTTSNQSKCPWITGKNANIKSNIDVGHIYS
ncbi:hypothetical protein L3V83_09375 [Thiotrichales bacterium 19X7-9]|nr:hypothetical protein [Thiotrichales bacterium 19X7-9]